MSKCLAKLLGLIVVATCFLTATNNGVASETNNSYMTIVERNAFGLKSSVPAIAAPAPSSLPMVKFYGLTRLTTFEGEQTKAYMGMLGKDGFSEDYFTLQEGERHAGIELSKIRLQDAQVEIMNSGVKQVLNLKDNGYSATPARLNLGNPHVQQP